MLLTQIVMVAVMTMTPVHMKAHGHDLAATGLVIAAHIAAMYLPSLVTGVLVDRIGRVPVAVAAGLTLLAAGVVSATAPGNSVALLTVALVMAFVPSCPGDSAATGRRELSAFAKPQVWLTLLAGAIGFGGMFAVYSYIAPTVTDVGGMMAHAAIVCREYGLPAVTGTAFGTKTIKTGQRIRVDGNQGTVTILES